jgi:hypothetical protein
MINYDPDKIYWFVQKIGKEEWKSLPKWLSGKIEKEYQDQSNKFSVNHEGYDYTINIDLSRDILTFNNTEYKIRRFRDFDEKSIGNQMDKGKEIDLEEFFKEPSLIDDYFS